MMVLVNALPNLLMLKILSLLCLHYVSTTVRPPQAQMLFRSVFLAGQALVFFEFSKCTFSYDRLRYEGGLSDPFLFNKLACESFE